MSSLEEREKMAQELVAEFGWSEEQAREFVDNPVGTQQLDLDGRYLLPIVERLRQIGVPSGKASVRFSVPASRWEEFKQAAREVSAEQGAIAMTPEEIAAVGPQGSGQSH